MSAPTSTPTSTPERKPDAALSSAGLGAVAQLAQDSVLSLTCEGSQLFAVLSQASAGGLAGNARPRTAVLIIVGGPQYRAGSHRHFVLTARHLAQAGYPTLRFDCRGMGDSPGPLGNFERVSPDISAAIDGLLTASQAQQVVLWGLCDGASAALLYMHERQDPRVAGLVLLNPWVRSVQTQAEARVKYYYWQRLRSLAFWKKLLTGGVGPRALAELASSVQQLGKRPRGPTAHAEAAKPLVFQDRMAMAFGQFGKPIFLALSENDQTAREFELTFNSQSQWAHAAQSPQLTQHVAIGADHAFSDSSKRQALDQKTVAWLNEQGL